MKKTVFLNTHSVLNPGDTAIVLAQIQFLKSLFGDLQIVMTSRTPEIDRLFYSRVGKIKILPPIIPAPSLYNEFLQKVRKSLMNLFNFSSKFELLKEIRDSDLVISSGGGYFYCNRKFLPGPMFLQNYFHVKLALILNKPVIFFPQSFGPFHNSVSLWILKRLLESDSIIKILVREEISFNLLQKILNKSGKTNKLQLCPDIAFYLKREDCESNFKLDLPRPIVAITLREWNFPEIKNRKGKYEKYMKYLSVFKEVCSYIYKKWNGSILIFSQVRGPGVFEDDRIITEKFLKIITKEIPQNNRLLINLPLIASPESIIEFLTKVDLLIATRLHSAILGLLANIPVINIAYQPKSTGTFKLIGMRKFCIDISDVEFKTIVGLIEEIFQSTSIKKEISNEISNIKSQIEKTLINVLNELK